MTQKGSTFPFHDTTGRFEIGASPPLDAAKTNSEVCPRLRPSTAAPERSTRVESRHSRGEIRFSGIIYLLMRCCFARISAGHVLSMYESTAQTSASLSLSLKAGMSVS